MTLPRLARYARVSAGRFGQLRVVGSVPRSPARRRSCSTHPLRLGGLVAVRLQDDALQGGLLLASVGFDVAVEWNVSPGCHPSLTRLTRNPSTTTTSCRPGGHRSLSTQDILFCPSSRRFGRCRSCNNRRDPCRLPARRPHRAFWGLSSSVPLPGSPPSGCTHYGEVDAVRPAVVAAADEAQDAFLGVEFVSTAAGSPSLRLHSLFAGRCNLQVVSHEAPPGRDPLDGRWRQYNQSAIQ